VLSPRLFHFTLTNRFAVRAEEPQRETFGTPHRWQRLAADSPARSRPPPLAPVPAPSRSHRRPHKTAPRLRHRNYNTNTVSVFLATATAPQPHRLHRRLQPIAVVIATSTATEKLDLAVANPGSDRFLLRGQRRRHLQPRSIRRRHSPQFWLPSTSTARKTDLVVASYSSWLASAQQDPPRRALYDATRLRRWSFMARRQSLRGGHRTSTVTARRPGGHQLQRQQRRRPPGQRDGHLRRRPRRTRSTHTRAASLPSTSTGRQARTGDGQQTTITQPVGVLGTATAPLARRRCTTWGAQQLLLPDRQQRSQRDGKPDLCWAVPAQGVSPTQGRRHLRRRQYGCHQPTGVAVGTSQRRPARYRGPTRTAPPPC